MPIIPDAATFQKSLAMLPISTYEPGEMIIAAGATTGRLLLLRQGVVEVLREGTQIARISEAGSVFGELAVLLGKPHTANVRALERSEFSVADAATLLTSDPAATLYIAAILAARLDAANVALIEVKRQLEMDEPRVAIARRVNKIADLLISGAGISYSPNLTESEARVVFPETARRSDRSVTSRTQFPAPHSNRGPCSKARAMGLRASCRSASRAATSRACASPE